MSTTLQHFEFTPFPVKPMVSNNESCWIQQLTFARYVSAPAVVGKQDPQTASSISYRMEERIKVADIHKTNTIRRSNVTVKILAPTA
jgi:hypothetical protein